MTEFKRLISYLYEYEGKVKGKNVGFVKLETRNGLCKLNVSIRKLYLGSGNLGVYLLSARQEIFLGNLVLRNGGGEFRTTVQAADIEQSGETMDGCYGLSIYEKKDSWKVYTTIWEDSLAKSAQYTSKGDHGNRTEKKARTAAKEEEEALTVHAAELPSIQTAEVMLIPEKEIVSLPAAQDNYKTNLEKNGRKNKREISEKNTANGKNRGIGKNIIIGKNAKDDEDTNMDEIAEIHADAEIHTNRETGINTEIGANTETGISTEIGANAELGINAEFNTNAETDGNAEHGTNTEAGGNAELGVNTETGGNAEADSNANVDINAEIRGNTGVYENKKAFNVEKYINRNETAEENEGRENCPQIEKIINTLSTYESKESKDNKDSRDNKETLIENSQKAAENMNTGKEKSTETMVSSNRPQQGIGNRFPRSRINNYTIPSRRPMGLPRENPSKERPQTESQGFSNHQPINQQPLNRQPVNQPMNRQFTNQQSVNQQPVNRQAINQPSINRQPTNQPFMNQQPINRQPINHQSISRQLINQHSINQQPLNYQPINQQPLNQQFINHHSVNHQPINQQPLNQSAINQQPLNQSPVNQQPMSQQPLNQQPMSQQPLNQQPVNQQPLNQQPLEQTSINQQAFIRQQPEEALIVGDPEALAKLEEEENIPPVPLWDFLSKTYPKIQAFESQYGCEILVIKPQDIGLLPREVWVYGNNSFLLHGYYNYRYLILARLENPHGLARYLLGVPGHYYNNEKYMASMFGFPNFVLSKKQQAQDGRFGYWYTDIRLGEQNVAAAVVRRAQTHTQA